MPVASLILNITDLPDLEILRGKECELNWEQRDRLITGFTVFCLEQRDKLDYSLAGMTTFSGSFADLRASFQALPANDVRFIISGWIKNYYDDIMLILHTPRTQLSIRTCNFVAAFASFLGPGLFDTFAENSLNHLLKLSGSTKKIISTAAADVAKSLFTTIVPQRAFPILVSGANDKNVNCRLRAFECLKIISERNYEDSSGMHQKIWESAVEKVLQKGIGDANAEIRSVALNIFLIFQERANDSVSRFMEKLDPSTKKQLSLLLAKTTGSKPSKPIVSTVPIAQIRKAMLKDHSSTTTTPEIIRSGSPIDRSSSTSPIKTNRLSPSKSNYELSTPKRSPIKSSYDYSPTKSKLSPSKSVSSTTVAAGAADVPMDRISVRPSSPTKVTYNAISTNKAIGSPMKIESCDVFMDAKSGDDLLFLSEDEEIILNVPNVIKSSTPSTPRVQEIEDLTIELPRKIQLDLSTKFSASSPSVSTRIKSLGLAAGTPLRAIYRNATEAELFSNFPTAQFFKNGNSLLNDLIEEFCTLKDENCLKKIISLTSNRSGDYDGLTSDLVHKLLISVTEKSANIKYKLLMNFFENESFLLSSSGKELILILEETLQTAQSSQVDVKSVCKSNLNQILIENCIELCCERISEFKLIFLAECFKNFIGANFIGVFIKSISPLSLALNHPNLNIRRLSINCLLEARNKLNANTQNLLNLLHENGVGLVQRRIIEGFLNQF